MAPGGPKSAPRPPQKRPKRPQERPGALQEAPKSRKTAPNRPKTCPRSPKDHRKSLLPINFTIDHPSKIQKKKYIDKTCCPSTLGPDINRYD